MGKRNTTRPRRRPGARPGERNTTASSSAVIRGPQLALPTSRNALTLKGGNAPVVSVRLPPSTLKELDDEIAKRNEGASTWNQVGRSTLILAAVKAWLKGKRE